MTSQLRRFGFSMTLL